MNKENNNEVFQCICGKQFEIEKLLVKHQARCKTFINSKRLPNGMFKCENPDCGKEHDGSYGSGRYCCKKCMNHGASLNASQNAIKNGNKHCPENFKTPHAEYGRWKCKCCNLIFETRFQLFAHNHEVHPVPKGQIWNKGLTKETDKRIKDYAIRYSDGVKSGRIKPSFLGRHLTKEHKDKIIATYIENRTNNKYRGTYKGIYFQYSFELAWIVWNLEHGIKIFRCEETFEYWDSEQKKTRTYYPDFQLEDGTIVEIKGRVTQCVYDKQDAVINKYKRKYVLLTQDKIQHCLDYCKEKYGNDFLTKLKDT